MATEEEKGKDSTSAKAPEPPSAPNTEKGNTASSEDNCSRDELTELVRAIKFAKPDASMRAVHREISEELSKKEGFGFLSKIQLNDVKRVWKKAVTSASQQTKTEKNAPPKEVPPELSVGNGVLKLYTVGDSSVRMLAQEYSQASAAEEAAKSEEGQKLMENYIHVFADVPMDRSGARPHQALINFNDNHETKEGKTKNTDNEENNKNNEDPKGEIVKIQVAASPDDTPYPILLYNADRSLKTFIHPDPQDDGYQRIRKLIVDKGADGALGDTGGTKAYFYARLTKPKKKGANVIISIDVSELAPSQTW